MNNIRIGAFHFHGVIDLPEQLLYINENGYNSCKYFDCLGFNSFLRLSGNKEKFANYITKYITKNNIKFPGGLRYLNSRGLKKPEVIHYPMSDDDYSDIIEELEKNDFFKFSNDNIKIRDFGLSDLNTDLLYIINKLQTDNKFVK